MASRGRRPSSLLAQGGTTIIYNIDGDWPALGCSLGFGKLVSWKCVLKLTFSGETQGLTSNLFTQDAQAYRVIR